MLTGAGMSCRQKVQSAYTPAALITGPQRSVSSFSQLRSPSDA